MTQKNPPPAKEELQKAYGQALLIEVNAGLAEFRRPMLGLLISSLPGGLDVSFSLLLTAAMQSIVAASFTERGDRRPCQPSGARAVAGRRIAATYWAWRPRH